MRAKYPTWAASFPMDKKFFANGLKAVKQHSIAYAHCASALRFRFWLYDWQRPSSFSLNSLGFTFSSSPSSFGISKFPQFSFRPLRASSRSDIAFKCRSFVLSLSDVGIAESFWFPDAGGWSGVDDDPRWPLKNAEIRFVLRGFWAELMGFTNR